MTPLERIAADLTAAMKARDEARLSVLRMAKSALKNKEIDKHAALDEAEAAQVLRVLVKQREDSVQQFEAADVGHQHVDSHVRRLPLFHRLEEGLVALAPAGFAPRALGRHQEDLADHGVVVEDEQSSGRHLSPL